ncbi:hypothetical protein Sjap_004841 [Stephania japonica]|uniref:Uncharacterized protein n=1 Tax=Stephania japonica TaxID=461633 RepID=A0AAP0PHC7_9MAGN
MMLSLMKLIKQDFDEIREDNSCLKKNRISALNIFYALAIAENMLLVWRKGYWEWQVTCCKLMEEVKRECDFGPNGVVRAIMAEQNKLQELMLGLATQYPSVKAPRIRRFTIELVIWLMRSEESHIYVFRELGMKQELENVMETTSELESFYTFSGSIGLNRYANTMQSLIDEALKLLSNGCVRF